MSEFMQDPAEGFRQAMRRLAATVNIISAAPAGERIGMTATAVTSVSMQPPALLCCINQSAELHGSIAVGARICINILGSSQQELSRIFSGGAQGEARFETGVWRADENAVPYLDDAQANIFCTMDLTLAYGTHTVCIAKVTSVRLSGTISPLIYQAGSYMAAKPID